MLIRGMGGLYGAWGGYWAWAGMGVPRGLTGTKDRIVLLGFDCASVYFL